MKAVHYCLEWLEL